MRVWGLLLAILLWTSPAFAADRYFTAAGPTTARTYTFADANMTIVGTTDTQTLTNKRITPRVVPVSDATSITPDCDASDIVTQANTQGAGTLTINAPTGSPVNGQKLIIRLSSTSVQTFSWDTAYVGSTDLALPTASTSGGKYDYLGFMYNSTATKWHLLAKNFGF